MTSDNQPMAAGRNFRVAA